MLWNSAQIGWQSDEIKISVLPDNSGYFVVGYDSSYKAKICKYLLKIMS